MEKDKLASLKEEISKFIESDQQLPESKRTIRVFHCKFSIQSPDELKVLHDLELLSDFSVFPPKEALERLKKYLELYREFELSHINFGEVKELLKDGKIVFHGKDKLGNPCLIIRAKLLFPNEQNIKLYMQMVYYNMQIGRKLAKEFDFCDQVKY
eukprot:TRINITY_DN121971_c0_g1_i1.p4 TRINITY_DN121971_c0_g1~~TRINITY_DN121971_c0_g1_i1.p4  ORF type:complete len:155 (+),score=29.07 TRINITY_DN121971_c0_g1_i1:147-611(+)